MAGVTAQGAKFGFSGFSGFVVGVSVETPTAEVVDMSSILDSAAQNMLVPTGSWSGGSISVDYLAPKGGADVQSLVRTTDWLTFAVTERNGNEVSDAISLRRRCILESATSEARVGELMRGSLRFRMTDYQGV